MGQLGRLGEVGELLVDEIAGRLPREVAREALLPVMLEDGHGVV